jgi:putative phage-type endonuclease
MHLYELPELTNEIENLIINEPPSIWETVDFITFLESCFELLEFYIDLNSTCISEPTFHEDLYEDLCSFLKIQFEDHFDDDYFEEDIFLIIDDIFELFIDSYSLSKTIDINYIIPQDHDKLEKRIDYLRKVPQPAQRTSEWYINRHTLITASNAYKAFGKEPVQNQLIYEKCKPIVIINNDDKPTNINSPLHWGQKYEPLSVMIYEYLYNSKVEDFGCIPHDKHRFLGASPDGIIVNKESDRYGRMLEIKNVVTRLIDGVPKKEYWVQMQLQMEVCDLDYCDFLETKFIELEDSHSFQDEKNKTDTSHGIILYFSKNMKPFYVYKPLHIQNGDIDIWIENTIQQYTNSEEFTWIKNIYWKLQTFSCVLVERNKEWFTQNIAQLQKTWDIILFEREHGYQHRAPKLTIKKNKNENQITDINCFLKVIKIDTEKFNY